MPTYYPQGGPLAAVNTCNAKIHPPLEAWPQLLSLKLFFGGGVLRNRCSEGLWFIKVADQLRYSTASLFFWRMLLSLPLAEFCQHMCAPCTWDLWTCALKGGLVCCFLKQQLYFHPQGSYLWYSQEQTHSFQKVSRTHSAHRAGVPAALCSLEENLQMLTHWFPQMKSRRQPQAWVSTNVRKVPLGLQCIFQCSVWNRNINRTFKMLLLGYYISKSKQFL